MCVLNLKQTNKYLIIPNGNPHFERKIVYYQGEEFEIISVRYIL